MKDDNEITTLPTTMVISVGGQGVFDALKSSGFYVWEVGSHYYLWIDGQPINIKNRTSLDRVLYAHHLLYPGVTFEGWDRKDFFDLCRSQSLSFDQSFKLGMTSETKEEYRKARRSAKKLKTFFKEWMLRYHHPRNTL